MAKYKIAKKKNLIKITRKSIKQVPVNEKEMETFQENLLPGLFRPSLEGKHRIVYTAPQSVSLYEYLRKGLNVHKFYSVITQVVEMVKRIEVYKFYPSNLVLDSKIIYVKETTGELFFLYEPLMSRENNTNIYAFLGNLVKEIRTDDRELIKVCKEFEEFTRDLQNYRLEDIESYIMQHFPQIYQEVKRAESGKSGFIASTKLANRKHYAPSAQMERTSAAYQELVIQNEIGGISEEPGTSLLEEGTTLLEENGTTLLNEMAATTTAVLIRRRNGEYITVYGPQFSIGKSTDNELCLNDNRAISRKHAVIYGMNGNFSVMDVGSTNHTYLNGEMLNPNYEAGLQDGDVIKFADEEFDFKIEY